MKQFYHILCPVDFSENSNHAIEQACFLARMFQADLTLVHVVSSTFHQSLGVVHGNDFDSKEMVDKATEDAREMLRKAKKEWVPYAVTCKSSIQYGNVTDSILEAAEATNASLIVMSANGSDNRVGMGRTALAVIQRSKTPVLSIKNSDGVKGYRKILIPINPTVGIGEVRGYITDYFSVMAPSITMVTVVPNNASTALKVRMSDYLKREAAFFTRKGLSGVAVDLVISDTPSECINAYANDNGFNLIMMNAYGKTGLREVSLGTVTGDLVNRAEIPLFTIHPSEEQIEASETISMED